MTIDDDRRERGCARSTATAGQKLTLTVSGNTIPGVDLIVRQPNNATVSSLFVSAATGVPRHVHPAGHRDLHDHGRPGRAEHRRPDLHPGPGARQHRHHDDRDADHGDHRRRSARTPCARSTATAGQKLTLTVTGNTIPGRQPDRPPAQQRDRQQPVRRRPPPGSATRSPCRSPGPTRSRRPGRPEHRRPDLHPGPGARQHRHHDDRDGDHGDHRRRSARTPCARSTATAGQKLTLTVTGNTIPRGQPDRPPAQQRDRQQPVRRRPPPGSATRSPCRSPGPTPDRRPGRPEHRRPDLHPQQRPHSRPAGVTGARRPERDLHAPLASRMLDRSRSSAAAAPLSLTIAVVDAAGQRSSRPGRTSRPDADRHRRSHGRVHPRHRDPRRATPSCSPPTPASSGRRRSSTPPATTARRTVSPTRAAATARLRSR